MGKFTLLAFFNSTFYMNKRNRYPNLLEILSKAYHESFRKLISLRVIKEQC